MKNFDAVKFKWTFRNYQQSVLDNSAKFLKDGRINIVAAPGSGKTILGLELIRRLNTPCIMFSPTTTIKQQWADRFEEAYLPEGENINDYVSFDLNNIKLLNSITYQALHSAIDKVAIEGEEENLDYSNINLFKLMQEKNIKTICLDEAHHLQNEWQKALEKFIKGLSSEVKVISLTATPPYDATPAEWQRYTSVCGEIDDEIFVPELVKQKNLCPHQDYILFNYPTSKETESFKSHRLSSYKAISEIASLDFINNLNNKIEDLYKNRNEDFYKNHKEISSLFIFLNHCNKKINKGVYQKLAKGSDIPVLTLKTAEEALQFLIEDTFLINEEEKEVLINLLKKYSLYHRKKVQLDLTDSLRKALVSSCGKLKSISTIVNSESKVLKENLSMLILTDYIKKESSANIGTNNEIDNISVVSIFEEVRRKNNQVKVGCLSGSLVILPNDIAEKLLKNYKIDGKFFKAEPLQNTTYSVYNFKGSNRDKVNIISKLFEDGLINVLVGTQSLLGEGWDSPCINSLILASYVGSFMLSNQMRGRAIRIYKKDENKTANIWHLVTIKPEYKFLPEELQNNIVGAILEPKTGIESNVDDKKAYNEQEITQENKDKNNNKKQENLKADNIKIIGNEKEIVSNDYETLCRRFNCFVGPNYKTNKIESGIERITFITPPYSEEGIADINTKMLNKAEDRQGLIDSWQIDKKTNSKTVVENTISSNLKIPVATMYNIFGLLFSLLITIVSVVGIFVLLDLNMFKFVKFVLIVACGIVFLYMSIQVFKFIKFIITHRNAKSSIQSLCNAILKTFKSLDKIEDKAKLNVREDKLKQKVYVSLKKSSLYEQNIFNNALKELLSIIDKPKYLIIKKRLIKFYAYKYSFACPVEFEKNANIVKVFKGYLKKSLGDIDFKFVHNEQGRKLLVKCLKKSYITVNYKDILKRNKVEEEN